MNKKLHFKSLLLLATMLFGASSAWAGETVYKSLTFPDDNSASNGLTSNQYGSIWTAEIGDDSWSISNFNNNNWNNDWSYIKCGRKKGSKEDTPSVATITTDNAIDQAISKVVVTLDAINKDDYNSIKLYVASDDAFSEDLTTITVDPIPSAAGEMTITIPEANRAENLYYKIEFDTKGTTSKNGHTVVSKVDYYIYQESGKTETTLSWSADSYSFNQGDSYTLPTLTATPAAIESDVTYESSNTDVATVATDGTVTIIGVGSTTITASYAGDDTYEAATDASYTLTVNPATTELTTYTKIEDLQKDATETPTPIKFTFNNILVTAVKGKNAYITDGTYGALVYTDGHGLNAGYVINGTIETTLALYSGQTEITDVKATDENLTITSGTVTATEKTLDEISAANQSLLVTLKGLTYDSSDKTFTDGTNKITYYRNFTTSDPTLENGKVYDVTGVVIVFNEKLEISPLNTDGVVEVATGLTQPTSVWMSDGEEVETVCVLKDGSISVSFETDAEGATKSFVSSNPTIAKVDDQGNITLMGKAGVTVITASTEATSEYNLSSAKLNVLVAESEPEDGVFDFSLFQDYGSGMAPTDDNIYVENERTWTAGNITMKTGGKVRWYIGQTQDLVVTYTLRLYGKAEPYSYMTLSAPEGYYITAIDGLASSLKANSGKISTGTWSGMAQEVTFTYESTSKNAQMSSLKVTYSKPEFQMEIGSDYTTFSSKMALNFSESGIAVYTAKVNNDGVVVLNEVESGEVPANRGVILKGTAGEHPVKLIESAEPLKNNELYGVTEDTKVVYNEEESTKYNYILQGNKFKKATEEGAILKAGKAYLSTKYDVTPAGARELKIVVDGETTGIKTVKTATDQNVYDLQGRKVAAPSKGLYIINGKKMIVK